MNAGVSGWVAANRQTIINSDAALDLEGLGLTDANRTCMSTPLVHGDALVGVLTVYAGSPLPISVEHAEALQRIAPQVARILRRAGQTDAPAAVWCAERVPALAAV
jgi:GAF domain-containing protein